MPDLVSNIVGNTVAGAVVGIAGVINRWIVYGVPFVYDAVVKTLGRWGEPVFAVALSLVLDIAAAPRAQFIESIRLPARMYIYGVYRLMEEAINMVSGKGFAMIDKGTVKTDPSDEVTGIFMQKGDTVVRVEPGSATATIGPRRYVALGIKRLYYFEAPYELVAGSQGSGG